jgi:hypothetical protein
MFRVDSLANRMFPHFFQLADRRSKAQDRVDPMESGTNGKMECELPFLFFFSRSHFHSVPKLHSCIGVKGRCEVMGFVGSNLPPTHLRRSSRPRSKRETIPNHVMGASYQILLNQRNIKFLGY